MYGDEVWDFLDWLEHCAEIIDNQSSVLARNGNRRFEDIVIEQGDNNIAGFVDWSSAWNPPSWNAPSWNLPPQSPWNSNNPG